MDTKFFLVIDLTTMRRCRHTCPFGGGTEAARHPAGSRAPYPLLPRRLPRRLPLGCRTSGTGDETTADRVPRACWPPPPTRRRAPPPAGGVPTAAPPVAGWCESGHRRPGRPRPSAPLGRPGGREVVPSDPPPQRAARTVAPAPPHAPVAPGGWSAGRRRPAASAAGDPDAAPASWPPGGRGPRAAAADTQSPPPAPLCGGTSRPDPDGRPASRAWSRGPPTPPRGGGPLPGRARQRGAPWGPPMESGAPDQSGASVSAAVPCETPNGLLAARRCHRRC